MTKITYKVIPADDSTFTSGSIQKIEEDGKVWSIPLDPSNSDYQAYLASLETAKK